MSQNSISPLKLLLIASSFLPSIAMDAPPPAIELLDLARAEESAPPLNPLPQSILYDKAHIPYTPEFCFLSKESADFRPHRHVLTVAGVKQVVTSLGIIPSGDFPISKEKYQEPKTPGAFSYIVETEHHILKIPKTPNAEAEGENQEQLLQELTKRRLLDNLPFRMGFPTHIISIAVEDRLEKLFYPLHVLPKFIPVCRTSIIFDNVILHSGEIDVSILRNLAIQLGTLQVYLQGDGSEADSGIFTTYSHGDFYTDNILITSIQPLTFALIDLGRSHMRASPLTDVVYCTRKAIWDFLAENPNFNVGNEGDKIHNFLTHFYAGYFLGLGEDYSTLIASLFDRPAFVTCTVTRGMAFCPNGAHKLTSPNPEEIRGLWEEYPALEASAVYMGLYSTYPSFGLTSIFSGIEYEVTDELVTLSLNLAYCDGRLRELEGADTTETTVIETIQNNLLVRRGNEIIYLPNDRRAILKSHLYRVDGHFRSGTGKCCVM